MQKIQVTIECAKETLELGQGLAAFVKSVRGALADGWQPGQDLPVIITSAVGDLVPSLQGADQVKTETEDKAAFANALYVGLSPIVLELGK